MALLNPLLLKLPPCSCKDPISGQAYLLESNNVGVQHDRVVDNLACHILVGCSTWYVLDGIVFACKHIGSFLQQLCFSASLALMHSTSTPVDNMQTRCILHPSFHGGAGRL